MSNVPPTRFLNLLCARTTKGGKLLGGYYGGKDLLKFHEHLKIVVHSISMKYILFFPALFLWQPRSYVQVEFLGSVHSEYDCHSVYRVIRALCVQRRAPIKQVLRSNLEDVTYDLV